MHTGVAYGVGVGPGDPELMTLKATRVLRACPVVAVPVVGPHCRAEESLAYQIAVAAVPELAAKQAVALPSPMVRKREVVEAAHQMNARTIEAFLDEGIDVACPVLGDPSIYSTFGYLRAALVADGYEASMVSGVPSFCAAAAELGLSLVEGDECLQVMPVRHSLQRELFSGPDSYVLMKAGSCLQDVKDCLSAAGLEAYVVERCGMEDERVYRGADQIPDEADYLTLVIARPPQ